MTYILICFTDFVPEAEMRDKLGNYYNYVNFSNIAVHIFIMVRTSILAIILSCKKCKRNRLAKEKAIQNPQETQVESKIKVEEKSDVKKVPI